jgi:hypothetical protein
MSIEYFGTPTPALTTGAKKSLVALFHTFRAIQVVRQTENEVGIHFPENKIPKQEDATILLKEHQVYIACHACNSTQRDKIVRFIETTLSELGYSCKLNED